MTGPYRLWPEGAPLAADAQRLADRKKRMGAATRRAKYRAEAYFAGQMGLSVLEWRQAQAGRM